MKANLHLVLDGRKASGEWTLVRIRGRDGEKNQWLILKTGADAKAPSKKADDQSVKTGRSMKQIAEDRDAEWESNRSEPDGRKEASPSSKFKARIRAAVKKKDERGRTNKTVIPSEVEESRGETAKITSQDPSTSLRFAQDDKVANLPAARPRFIEPMKAKLVDNPPRHGDWIYELKFDGFRAIAVEVRQSDGFVPWRNRQQRFTVLPKRKQHSMPVSPKFAMPSRISPRGSASSMARSLLSTKKAASSFQLLQALEMEGRKSPLAILRLRSAPTRWKKSDAIASGPAQGSPGSTLPAS